MNLVPSLLQRRIVQIAIMSACSLLSCPTWAAESYTLFESGQVRPLAQAGGHLFVTNTPDNRLEIFDVSGPSPIHVSSVSVGLEPVAVAARNAGEVWVVNHLSDSISIVDVSTASAPRVVRTLLVGDEPRDIVFAGAGGNRAFITTAHRGQNSPYGSTIYTELTTPGIGRADVWVFDATNLGTTLGGTSETIVTLFADTPRALAVSADGNTVYAAAFQSGNRTTTISEGLVCDGGSGASFCGNVCFAGPNMHAICSNNSECPSSFCFIRSPGGLPAPNVDHNGLQQPEVGLIVKYNGTHWLDELGRFWDNAVNFNLPDEDVFAIDATQNPPVETAAYTGVGTILFNMAVNPVSGRVYVSNTDAQNDVRFEGAGTFAAMFKPMGEPASVRGHLAESRITVLDGPSVLPRHLNKHINYASCCAAAPNVESEASLAFPLGMAVSSDGLTLYVAGFGSSKIGIYSTAAIEGDTFTPGAGDVTLDGLGTCPGGSCGPTGLVLDEAHSQLYALTRFNNSLAVVSTATGDETGHISLHNPESASIVDGRRFNYDARFTSSHGDSACASCHIFADFDSLAWDLGDPDGNLLNNPGPFAVGPFAAPPASYKDFHPMKGPMTTQSLRGMANHGPMHWRGDRTGGNDTASSQPNNGAFDEQAGFKKFNPAFAGLLGRSAVLATNEMQAYTDFILQVAYPPNPIQGFDGAPDNDRIAGEAFFNGPISDTLKNCDGCHRLDHAGNANFGVDKPGFFGSDGQSSFENETQHFKVPHLRNMYQKVGMFGMEQIAFLGAGDNLFMGDQVRGFGFLHDGSMDTLFRFHNAAVFDQGPGNAGGIPVGPAGDPLRRQIEAFMLAFDSNLPPIVGQQVTRTSTNGVAVGGRLNRIVQAGSSGQCDVVVKGRVGGTARGYLYAGSNIFVSDRANDPPLDDAALQAKANVAGQELTYTCAPVGSGVRNGLDRDGDGYGDGDETDAGSDPADPSSTPTGVPPICSSTDAFPFKTNKLTNHNGSLTLLAKDLPLTQYNQEPLSISINGLVSGAVFSGTIPGASIIHKGKVFRFAAPFGSTGITRIVIKESRTPGLFQVNVKVKHGWTTPVVDAPNGVFVQLNIGGTCFFARPSKISK